MNVKKLLPNNNNIIDSLIFHLKSQLKIDYKILKIFDPVYLDKNSILKTGSYNKKKGKSSYKLNILN